MLVWERDRKSTNLIDLNYVRLLWHYQINNLIVRPLSIKALICIVIKYAFLGHYILKALYMAADVANSNKIK